MARALTLLVLVGLTALAVACGDDGSSGGEVEMVTIAGIVRSIDDLSKAEGVKVRLLDTSYADEVATGTDGAYELTVPKGSKLILVTDDFNPGLDAWFPMINMDWPPVVANSDILDFAIHACPLTTGTNNGSLAVYDQYLKAQDDANGDIFTCAGVKTCSGIVVIPFWGCAGGNIVPDGYTFKVSSDNAAFPVAYMRICNPNNPWDATCSPLMHPPTRTVTDDYAGLALSFGDPSFTGNTVGFTLDDTLSTRNVQWTPNLKIPVRRGTLTLAWGIFIDGVGNKSLADFIEACDPLGGP